MGATIGSSTFCCGVYQSLPRSGRSDGVDDTKKYRSECGAQDSLTEHTEACWSGDHQGEECEGHAHIHQNLDSPKQTRH